MGIKITASGPLSTIQDNGRIGYMDFGFSPSGCMDLESMHISNLLVGNHKNEAVIEITYGGLSGVFTSKAIFAITGADVCPTINGLAIPMYKAIEVKEGDVLACGYAKTGLRAYLAFCSGLYLKKVMGSASTNRACKIGGYLGRELRALDLLFFNNINPKLKKLDRREIKASLYSNHVELRSVRGADYDRFTDGGRRAFFSSNYRVSKDSDRMGVRLEGSVVESRDGYDVISNGMALGEVQIAASGQPIIMAADRQTTGGYTKIVTVASIDMSYVAQVRPNDSVVFKELDYETLIKICNKRRKTISSLEKKWK
ncbi:MAG: biotin-dependent carboxyltransferase family protein [Christensenellaceae bacterium]|jgi:biotin-dependent carboxylase-like uncharacterized protein|nr:biotin-dependent carboxyltransferase family protein [Christensenellaceae bacterium]